MSWMISILASVAALTVLWFVWIKFQQTRWRHIADDLYFEKFEELKIIDFDSLVATVGQRLFGLVLAGLGLARRKRMI